jgi:hypothetical protein
MALFRRNHDNTFRSALDDELERVTAKHAAAEQDLASVQDEIRGVSREAVLSDDPDAILSPLYERERKAQLYLTACRDALADVQQAKRAKVAEAQDAAEKANRRAKRQRVAKLVKLGGDYRRGLQQVDGIKQEMLREVGKLEPLYRPDERRQMFGHTSVESALITLLTLEQLRQAPDAVGSLPPQGRLGVAPLKPHGKSWNEVDPIETQIERRFGIDASPGMPTAPLSVETIAGQMAEDTPAFVPDAIDQEMERVRRLAAGEAPPAPANPEGE